MDKASITWNDMKENLATMNLATADVLIDLRRDFCTTGEEDIRELVITLTNAADVVIAGCDNLTKDMHILDCTDLMSCLYSETGVMLNCAYDALITFRTSRSAGQTRMLQILEQRVAELQRSVEDFEDAANRIIDEGM